MGCIFRLTAIVALATGVNISLANETFAYPASDLPEAFSGKTELLDQHLSNSDEKDGIPGDADRTGGSRSLRNSVTNEDGIPDADGDTGSR
jgi:hypothetical protein